MKKIASLMLLLWCAAPFTAYADSASSREELKQSYAQGCKASGWNDQLCTCTFDHGIAQLSQREINQLARGQGTPELASKFGRGAMDAFPTCAGISPEEFSQMQTDVSVSDIKHALRTGFVQSCTNSSGGASRACQCIYDKTTADFTDADYIDLDRGSQEVLTRFATRAQTYASECR